MTVPKKKAFSLPSLTDVIAVLMAGATIVMGIMIPQIWGMSRDLGALQEGQNQLKENVASLGTEVRQGFATVNTTVSTLISRVNENTMDPGELLAKAGLQVSRDYKVYVMGDDSFVVLATTPDAVAKMQSAGYSPTQITPYLQGFVIKKAFGGPQDSTAPPR
jgi:hypothetical protein